MIRFLNHTQLLAIFRVFQAKVFRMPIVEMPVHLYWVENG